jgi:hypothetical protein
VLFTAVLTPVALVAAIGILINIALYSVFALTELSQFKTWWETNKQAIVCSLYVSGDAATALAAISNFISDGVQAIEWTGVLAPLAPELAVAVGALMSQIENNNLVNILFKLVTDVALPNVTCDCSGQYYEFHFDEGDEDWEELYDVQSPNTGVGQWLDTVLGGDGTDSPGRLVIYLTRSDGSKNCKGGWIFTLPGTPIATREEALQADICQGASGGVCRYYLRIQYTDATEDETILIAQDSQWKQCSVAVSSGNVGKSIKYFYVLFDFNGSDTGACDFGIDNVRTNVPMP